MLKELAKHVALSMLNTAGSSSLILPYFMNVFDIVDILNKPFFSQF